LISFRKRLGGSQRGPSGGPPGGQRAFFDVVDAEVDTGVF
jgi:hypothetical protein